MRLRSLLLFFTIGALVVNAATLENSHVRFNFSEKNGALLDFVEKKTGRTVQVGKEGDTPWEILLLDDIGRDTRLCRATVPPKAELQQEKGAQTLRMFWQEADFNVAATILLKDNRGIAEWRLEVSTHERGGQPAPWVKEAVFPCIEHIAPLGDDSLIYGEHLGRRVRQPGKRLPPVSIHSPGSWSMQFCAFHGSLKPDIATDQPKMLDGFNRATQDDECGLFVAADDGAGYYKVLRMKTSGNDQFSVRFVHLPSYPFWPMDKKPRPANFNYSVPYAVHFGALSGGYEEACDLYREIALAHDGARKFGPLRSSGNPVARRMLENVFWGKLYYGANHIVPGTLALQDYLRVPMTVHWYRYSVHPFDDDNIDFFPSTGQFREGIRTLRDAGIGVAPYVCCAALDPDTENYRRYGMDKAIVLNEVLMPNIWRLAQQPSHQSNSASPLWRKAYRMVTSTLFGQWDTDGQYLDVMAAHGLIDYGAQNNPPHGGNYWVEGNRALLDELYATIRKSTNEPFLVSEGFSENYLGQLDGFLMLDITRLGWVQSSNVEIIPLTSRIYHDYALFYGSDCNQAVPIETFRWNMALSFAWGIQLCYSTRQIETPGLPHDVFTRDLARAWHCVANKYLNGGRLLDMAQLPPGHSAANAAAVIWTEPFQCNVELDNGKRIWRGPSILGSLWQASDKTLAITMVNLSGKPNKATLLLRRDKLPVEPNHSTIWRSWPLPAQKLCNLSAETNLEVELPANTCMVLEIRDDTAPAVRELTALQGLRICADKEGKILPVASPNNNIYGCEGAWLKHDKGQLYVCDENGAAMQATTFTWLKKTEGLGGPRLPKYRTFYFAKPSSVSMKSGNGTITAALEQDVLTAKVHLETAGVFQNETPSGVLLAIDTSQKLHCAKDGVLALPSGDYRLAAWNGDVPLNNAPSWNELAKLARESAAKGETTLSGSDNLHHLTRLQGERALALANAITWLATGQSLPFPQDEDVLIAGQPRHFDTAVQLLNQSWLDNVKIDNGTQVTLLRPLPSGTLLRLLQRRDFAAFGLDFPAARLRWLEAMEPLLPEISWRREEIVLGDKEKEFTVDLSVANISPFPQNVAVTAADFPAGWTLEKTQFALQPQESRMLTLKLRHDGVAPKAETQIFEFGINYTDSPEMMLHESFTLRSRNTNVYTVRANKKAISGVWTGGVRNKTLIAFPASKKKRKVTLDFRPFSFGSRTARSLECILLDERLQPVKTNTVSFDGLNPSSLTLALPKGETTFVQVQGSFYHLRIQADNYGLCAWRHIPLHLFAKQETTLYFHVNKGAKEFAFGCQDGGPAETALLVIRDPEGKEHFRRNGNFAAFQPIHVAVPKGMDGKAWSVTVNPREDVEIWLEEGAASWLSLEPQSIISEIRN